MRLNLTSVWKVKTFEFFESFRCSIASVSICDALESDLRVKSNDHLNFSRASVVQFRASRYIMRLNRTSEFKVMTIWISRELPLFNFERLNEWCPRIGHPGVNLWPFEFLESFRCPISGVSIYYAPESDLRLKSYDHFEFLESSRCSISSVSIYYAPESDLRVKSYDNLNFSRASVVQFRASRHIMRPNRTSVWKVMTIWISRELPWFNSEHLDILCARIWPPTEKLWPFELLKSFHCSISRVSIYYSPESDLQVKSYNHLNCSRASIVQFRSSRYIMRLNRTSECKVMTIWIAQELPLFNFERLDILCTGIEPPSEKLWPFELFKSFHCSISSVSIYNVP